MEHHKAQEQVALVTLAGLTSVVLAEEEIDLEATRVVEHPQLVHDVLGDGRRGKASARVVDVQI